MEHKVDKYFAGVQGDELSKLEIIRSLVKKNIPEAEEVISYGMPGFKYRGVYLLGYAAFKDHLSLFPTAEPMEYFAEELKGFKTSKGTIQFTEDNPLTEELIVKIIDYRKKQIDEKN